MDYVPDSDEDELLQQALRTSRVDQSRKVWPPRRHHKKKPEVIEILDSDDEEIAQIPPPTSGSASHSKKLLKMSKPPAQATQASIGGESEDEEARFQADLARAIAASASEGQQPSTSPGSSSSAKSVPPSTSESPTKEEPKPTPSNPQSLFLAERAKLEAERLQRAKRLWAEAKDSNNTSPEGPPKKRRNLTPSTSSSTSSSRKPSPPHQAVSTPSSSSTSNMFWDGEIRPVANMFTEPTQDPKPTFRLTEILNKNSEKIKFIVISSFCTDYDWLAQILPEGVPLVLIGQSPSGDASVQYHPYFQNWVLTTPFLRNGRGCMHMKFMLVFYASGRLRIMITTANMIGYDWQQVENMAWVQDVPLLASPIPHDRQAADFPAHFQNVLRKLNFEPALQSHLHGGFPELPLRSIQELRTRWDFSKVTVQLIASIAGTHTGWPDVIRSGHTMLMSAIRQSGAKCPDGKELKLEYQGSSIGTYSSKWLNEFYDSARGVNPERWLDPSPSAQKRRAALPHPANIKIIFPSLSTVDNTRLGRPGGGTMWCQEKQWKGTNFPRQLFHDSKSKRGKALMHTKMILGIFSDKPHATSSSSKKKVSGKEKELSDPEVGGWCYMGSHNFTPSAWGTLGPKSTSFTPILNITNYELGLFFTLPAENTQEVANDVACWVRPPPAYRRNVDVPWMQAVHGSEEE